jgi:hypothetical protein
MKKKSKPKNKNKNSKMNSMQRYNFYSIFGINPNTRGIYPLYNMFINGQYFPRNISIQRGLSFGGINIYQFIGRDFGGTWNQTTQILNLTTVY